MFKYKVAVYAISKNEEKFVDRWVESMKEADKIFVLDTGSTDNTVKKLKDLNVKVKTKKIVPWRFDTARNISLDMVPNDYDICVCTDLDEVFEKGWREKLENLWKSETNRGLYNYNWKLDEKDRSIVNFNIEKIHCRKGYRWIYPVHEVLKYFNNDEQKIYLDGITLNHYPNINKSRAHYLDLLKLSVKENPDDDRNMHYLGREYMYYGMWNESIDTLIKHLNLEKSVWKEERSASMRFIGRCYKKLNRIEESRMWIKKAIDETPNLRDPYVEMALLEYEQKNWLNVEKYCLKALKIKERKKIYINETFSWDNTIDDLLSLSYYHQNKIDLSLKYAQKALKYNKNDERIKQNIQIIKKKSNK